MVARETDLMEKRELMIKKISFFLFNQCKVPKRTKRYLDGSYYEGQMSENKLRNGFGVYYFPNGDVYIGEWVRNQMEGKGTYFYIEGDVYDGTFVEGTKDGFGTFYYTNGHLFHGEWVNDNKAGKGIYVYGSDHERFEGEWKFNVKEGYGFYYYASGECVEGRWFNNIKQYSKIVMTEDGRDTMNEDEKNNLYQYGLAEFYEGEIEKCAFVQYVGSIANVEENKENQANAREEREYIDELENAVPEES